MNIRYKWNMYQIPKRVETEMLELDELVLASLNDLPTPTQDAALAVWIRDMLNCLEMETTL